jgi:hypothetical protein
MFLIGEFPLSVQLGGLESGKGVCERCGNQAIAALIHGRIATTIDAIKPWMQTLYLDSTEST